MKLWIRNQDRKELRSVRSIALKGRKVEGRTMSMGITAPDQSTLGEYETEERAMEVLDSIQKKIYRSITVAVFDMPKE